MKNNRQAAFSFAVFVCASMAPQLAVACATCLCGDQTLTTLGNEKPFAGRTRVSINGLYRKEKIGQAGFNQREITEQRYTLGLGYWATDKLALSLRAPWSDKKLEDDNLAQQKASGFGDIEVDARYYLWSDKSARPRHLMGVQIGTRIPTAEKIKSHDETLDPDVQPGAGLWIPSAGVWYGFYRYPWSVNAQMTASVGAGKGFEDYEFGKTLNSSVTGQYALGSRWALQIGLDTRLSSKDSYNGVDDQNSGGFIAYLSPGVSYEVATDWLLTAKVQYAVIDDLNGDHEEKYVAYTGVAYDF